MIVGALGVVGCRTTTDSTQDYEICNKPKGRSVQGNYVLTSFGRTCGFNVSAKKCTTVILANMIAHNASVESKVILCNIGDP